MYIWNSGQDISRACVFRDWSRIRGCENFVGNPGDHFSSLTLREDVESGSCGRNAVRCKGSLRRSLTGSKTLARSVSVEWWVGGKSEWVEEWGETGEGRDQVKWTFQEAWLLQGLESWSGGQKMENICICFPTLSSKEVLQHVGRFWETPESGGVDNCGVT